MEQPSTAWLGGIFEMIGAGREVFGNIDPDEYVRQLRDGWEEQPPQTPSSSSPTRPG